MTLRQILEVIKGYPVNLPGGGSGRVMETYWANETCLIKIDKNSGYDIDFGYGVMNFVSDGTDQLVIPLSDLERVNP